MQPRWTLGVLLLLKRVFLFSVQNLFSHAKFFLVKAQPIALSFANVTNLLWEKNNETK